ncbi:MAG: IS200/IS605 family transposase [Puniceicoccaceae bacterium]
MSYISAHFHCVFSTKRREPLLTPMIRSHLWPYMGGIARAVGMEAIEVGGVEDHVHILLSIPATMPLSRAMQLIKGGSSRWLNESHLLELRFAWQKEYAAFSVSTSALNSVKRYIQNQEEHHRRQSFKGEYTYLLDKAGVEYNERYLWD